MPKRFYKMSFFFDLVAIKAGGDSCTVHCENPVEFQKEDKILYEERFNTLSAYVFNDNGFQRKVNYIRGKEGWLKIN